MSSTPIGFIYFSRMITRIKENAIRQNAKQIIFLLDQYLTSPTKPLTLTQISYCRNLLLYIDDPSAKARLTMLLDNHFAKLSDHEKSRSKLLSLSNINRRPPPLGNSNTPLQQNNQPPAQSSYEHDLMDNQESNMGSISDQFYYFLFCYYYFLLYIKVYASWNSYYT